MDFLKHMASANPIYAVTISGETGIEHLIEGTATVGVRVNTDGTIDKREGSGYTQVDAATDWIIPNAFADSSYEVKIEEVSLTGTGSPTFTNPGGSGKGTGTWFDLSANRMWTMSNAVAASTSTWTITLSIRRNGGATIDSANYQMTAISDSPP